MTAVSSAAGALRRDLVPLVERLAHQQAAGWQDAAGSVELLRGIDPLLWGIGDTGLVTVPKTRVYRYALNDPNGSCVGYSFRWRAFDRRLNKELTFIPNSEDNFFRMPVLPPGQRTALITEDRNRVLTPWDKESAVQFILASRANGLTGLPEMKNGPRSAIALAIEKMNISNLQHGLISIGVYPPDAIGNHRLLSEVMISTEQFAELIGDVRGVHMFYNQAGVEDKHLVCLCPENVHAPADAFNSMARRLATKGVTFHMNEGPCVTVPSVPSVVFMTAPNNLPLDQNYFLSSSGLFLGGSHPGETIQ